MKFILLNVIHIIEQDELFLSNKWNITLTMIISKLLDKWSGKVRFETSSSLIPLKRSCFFRSFVAGGLTVIPVSLANPSGIICLKRIKGKLFDFFKHSF